MSPSDPPIAMLWESSNPRLALAWRFRFATVGAACRWLERMAADCYDLRVARVERLAISAHNLLAWLATPAGPRLAKCCSNPFAHARLARLAALTAWLDQQGLPVSNPLPAHNGQRQVRYSSLSVSMQRIIAGDLLDPAQPPQAEAAGVALARLHQLLAVYARAADFGPPVSARPLPATAPSLSAAGQAPQLVHGDFRAANVLYRDGAIAAILDFEELRWGYRVDDLAWAAVHLTTRYNNWRPTPSFTQSLFLGSYINMCPLSPAEEAWLPSLVAYYSTKLARNT